MTGPEQPEQPDVRGVFVYRAGDDSEQPERGVIEDRAGTLGADYVWVTWESGDGTPVREALADIRPAGLQDLLTPPTGPGLAAAAAMVPPPAAACPRCSQGRLLTNERPHCPRCGWYERPLSDDRALLEAVSEAYRPCAFDEPQSMTLLQLLDAGTIDIAGFWRTANELCLCWSCGGECGGKGEVGWCGPVELQAGRLVCDTCREQADIYDQHRVGVAARVVDGDHISLLIDPFDSYRKRQARLSPDEAVTLGMRLLQLAGELAIDAPAVETICDTCRRPAVQQGGRWRHRDIADEVFCNIIGGGK